MGTDEVFWLLSLHNFKSFPSMWLCFCLWLYRLWSVLRMVFALSPLCLHYASTLATMSVLYKSSFLLFSTTVIEFCLCLFNIIRCWVEICKYCLLLLEFVHLHSFAKSLWRLGGLGNQWGVPIMQYFKSDLRLVWVNEWDTSVLFISLGRSACM